MSLTKLQLINAADAIIQKASDYKDRCNNDEDALNTAQNIITNAKIIKSILSQSADKNEAAPDALVKETGRYVSKLESITQGPMQKVAELRKEYDAILEREYEIFQEEEDPVQELGGSLLENFERNEKPKL